MHKHFMGFKVEQDLERLQSHPGLQGALKHLDTQYTRHGQLAYKYYL